MNLSDAEIIKACECCANNPNELVCYESKCPLFGLKCIDILSENALALINRQQAEIERLKSKVNRLKRYDEERDIRLHASLIATAKSEAYKEFAERLKAMKFKQDTISADEVVYVENIDDLLKEMG